jgi:hypothetical protein
MAPKFFSKEWLDTVIEKANTDKKYLDKTKKFKASYLFIVTDCPDGSDVKILLKFDKGKVVDHEYEAQPAPATFRMENEPWDPSESLVRAQGSYDTYKKLQLKELNSIEAMKANLYQSEGNIIKVMALLPFSNAYMDLQATVDCEY